MLFSRGLSSWFKPLISVILTNIFFLLLFFIYNKKKEQRRRNSVSRIHLSHFHVGLAHRVFMPHRVYVFCVSICVACRPFPVRISFISLVVQRRCNPERVSLHKVWFSRGVVWWLVSRGPLPLWRPLIVVPLNYNCDISFPHVPPLITWFIYSPCTCLHTYALLSLPNK